MSDITGTTVIFLWAGFVIGVVVGFFVAITLPRRIRGGYQPRGPRLDPTHPPRSGSGVPGFKWVTKGEKGGGIEPSVRKKLEES